MRRCDILERIDNTRRDLRDTLYGQGIARADLIRFDRECRMAQLDPDTAELCPCNGTDHGIPCFRWHDKRELIEFARAKLKAAAGMSAYTGRGGVSPWTEQSGVVHIRGAISCGFHQHTFDLLLSEVEE